MLTGYLTGMVGNRQAAEDLAQEAFLVAYASFERYDPARPFSPWLRGVARNLALKSLRRPVVVHLLDDASLQQIEDTYGRIESTHGDNWEAKVAAFRTCLERLKGEERQTLELYYKDGGNCQRVADALKVGVQAIRKRLQRARTTLGECIHFKLRPSRGQA